MPDWTVVKNGRHKSNLLLRNQQAHLGYLCAYSKLGEDLYRGKQEKLLVHVASHH